MRLLLLAKRISAALRSPAAASLPRNPQTSTTSSRLIKFQPSAHAPGGTLLDSPWFATQLRRARFSGADVCLYPYSCNSYLLHFPFFRAFTCAYFSYAYPTICSKSMTLSSASAVEFIDVLVATNLQIVPFMAIFMLAQVRPGNVIERKDENQASTTLSHSFMYQMVVELRDVDSGSKVNERLRTDEPVQKIFVQEKSFTYLYTDDETGNIVLMEPKTYSQLEVPRHLFGESLVYLQDDMEVTVQLYDERPLSVKIPHRVTCTVTEAAEALRGSGPTAYKKVLLDNGLTVQESFQLY
ncbi:Elongation factor P [Sesamum angolense]|uniref:Elongation factor P n=1 Tax=Sesamum angolense TaxID=2727404 RepID=A0AAE2C502_9LAMI|nr:Elongation factor P [Sesamum angolense]